MTLSKCTILLAAAVLMPLMACQKNEASPAKLESKAEAKKSIPTDPIESATAAAPSSVSANATVIQAAADGSMKVLRQGGNGWTCMPDNPQTPGHDPMCMDANGLKWAQAWMAHKDPPAGAVGCGVGKYERFAQEAAGEFRRERRGGDQLRQADPRQAVEAGNLLGKVIGRQIARLPKVS